MIKHACLFHMFTDTPLDVCSILGHATLEIEVHCNGYTVICIHLFSEICHEIDFKFPIHNQFIF